MRRIALHGIVLAGCLAAGCGTSHQYRNISTGRTEPVIDSGLTRVSGTLAEGQGRAASDDPEAPAPKRFARGNVPNSVMLRDQAESGYRDDVVPH
jgi:hypothetical protein